MLFKNLLGVKIDPILRSTLSYNKYMYIQYNYLKVIHSRIHFHGSVLQFSYSPLAISFENNSTEARSERMEPTIFWLSRLIIIYLHHTSI